MSMYDEEEFINAAAFFADKDDRPPCIECRFLKQCWHHFNEWNQAVAQYPDACRECAGSGGVTWSESVGDGLGSMPMADVCSCVYDGHCPRCGQEIDWESDDQVGRCRSCGWNEEKDSDPVIPYEMPYCRYYESIMFDPWPTDDDSEAFTAQERNPGFRSW